MMEHVPLPSSHTTHRVKIPLITRQQWDGKDFMSYPDRAGWRKALSEKLWNEDPNAFMQTWLFFGLISAIFGRTATFDEFTFHDDEKHRWITTAPLTQCADWQLRTGSNQDLIQHRLEHAVTCLKEARKEFYVFLQDVHQWDILPELALSISTTAEYLCRLIFASFQHCIPRSPADGKMLSTQFRPRMADWHVESLTVGEIVHSLAKFHQFINLDWGHRNGHSYCYQEFLSKGWCIRKTLKCLMEFDATTAYHASYFDGLDAGTDHSRCKPSLCSADLREEASYQTVHTKETCACQHIGVSDTELFSILGGQWFPLIVGANTIKSTSRLLLQTFQPGMSYVAISHVWSDGLGNPHANSLPHCQFMRIAEAVAQLLGPEMALGTPFWIDTICCPVQDGVNQDLAITKMKDTYAMAEWVLVFDSWLASQSVHGLSNAEILVKISCSKWNERLWTLQEGLLAKKLAFQFYDAIWCDFEQSMTDIWLKRDLAFVGLHNTVIAHFSYLHGFKNMEDSALHERLELLQGTLKFRNTSVASDEVLCLSTLLGLNMVPILKTSKQDRMKIFWSNFAEIPTRFIFGKGDRLPHEQYGWAPLTLRDPFVSGASSVKSTFNVRQHLPLAASPSIRCEYGLQISTSGFLLPTSKDKFQKTFRFFDTNNHLYHVECDPQYPGFPFKAASSDLIQHTEIHLSDYARRNRPRRLPMCIAVICAHHLDDSAAFFDGDLINAVLVAVLEQANHKLRVEYVAPIRISRENSPDAIEEVNLLVALLDGQTNHKNSCILNQGYISVLRNAKPLLNQDWVIF